MLNALIVLGSIDDRVGSWAAEVSRGSSFRVLVFTGGLVPLNSRQSLWEGGSEAEHFYSVFKASGGVGNVLPEKYAQHTGENAALTYKLLQQARYSELGTVLLATKPYMERRAVADFSAQWADNSARFIATSHPTGLEEYCTDAYPLRETVRIMMKDFGTLETYASNGWWAPQEIPKAVQKAAAVINKWLLVRDLDNIDDINTMMLLNQQ